MSEDKPRILIVDDESRWSDAVTMLLQDRYDIEAVETAEEGIKKVQENHYDLLLIDWRLIGKTGTELTTEIKKFNQFIPVILVSGKIDERRPIIEAIHKGISDYVEKDAKLSRELPAAIERQLRARDKIILAFEKWLKEFKDPDKVLIRSVQGKEYSAREILEEIKKDSKLGRSIWEEIIKIVLDLAERGDISL